MNIKSNLIYRDKDQIYHPDTCEPLVKAFTANKLELHALARLSYPGSRLGKNVLTGINTIGFWNAYTPQDWGLDWHRNEGVEIAFLESGSLSFELENDSYQLFPDSLTITRPWQPHKLGNPNIGVGKLFWIVLDVNVRHPHQSWEWPSWILISKKDIDELSKMLRQNEQPIWKVNLEIRRCFQKIGQLLSSDESTHTTESWIAIYVNELLMQLLNLFRQGSFTYNESLVDGSRTLNLFLKELKEFYHQEWTLETMASHCNLGVTRFVHYFKLLTNQTPMKYLNTLRLEASKEELLKAPSKNISEICYENGFSSSQYFATLFKKQYNKTPQNFRAENAKVVRS